MPSATLPLSASARSQRPMGSSATFVSLFPRSRRRQKIDIQCYVVGKVEFMSAGGSVKDRIAKAMVEAAEKDGKLLPGKSVVIEPTSGNTGTSHIMRCAIVFYTNYMTLGIGLAMACAIKVTQSMALKFYRC